MSLSGAVVFLLSKYSVGPHGKWIWFTKQHWPLLQTEADKTHAHVNNTGRVTTRLHWNTLHQCVVVATPTTAALKRRPKGQKFSYPRVCREFKARVGHSRPCLKQTNILHVTSWIPKFINCKMFKIDSWLELYLKSLPCIKPHIESSFQPCKIKQPA